MRRRKLKGFVIPALYLVFTFSIFAIMVLVGSDYSYDSRDYDYGIDTLTTVVKPVISEEEVVKEITKPVDDNINLSIHFYNSKDTKENQKNSIIYYEDTYLPNTGVIYTSDKSFEISSIYPGEVLEILNDDNFGKYVVVEHINNIKTYYYGLEDVSVSVGDELKNNTVIGISKQNPILNNKYTLLLEVYHNNKLINPETFMVSNINDYK